MLSIQSKGVLDPYSKSFVPSIIPIGDYAELSDQFNEALFWLCLFLRFEDPKAISLKVTSTAQP